MAKQATKGKCKIKHIMVIKNDGGERLFLTCSECGITPVNTMK